MSKFFKSLAITLLLICSFNVNADCNSVVRYVNGIWNKTRDDSTRITATLQNSLSAESKICVEKYLFNPSQNLLTDIAETYDLRRTSEEGFWNNMWNGLVVGLTASTGNIVGMFTGDNPLLLYQKVIDDMYAIVKSDLDRGKPSILVAHSEGNLFALRIQYMAIKEGYNPSRVQLLHLAPPTVVKKEAGRESHILSAADKVISLLPKTNTPNFVPGVDTGDGHGAIAVYLNPELTETFSTFDCQKVKTNPLDVAASSIKRLAQCQAEPCVYIGFTLGCE